MDIGGTGTPGATATVTINDHVQTTTVTPEGTWTVRFPPAQVDPGTYETPVLVVIENHGKSIIINDHLVVDTEVALTFEEDAVGGDGMVNAVEQDGVVTLTGTVDAGSTLTVVVNAVTYTAVVTGTTWSLALPAGALVEGVLTQAVSVTAVDPHENTIIITGSFQIDTENMVAINAAAIGGNNLVNRSEHAGGVPITGTAEAGASVVVTVGTVFHTVIAGADGIWSVTFASFEIPAGVYQATVTAVSTDAAGNTATATGTFEVDTESMLSFDEDAVGGDGMVNALEQAGIVTLSGTTASGSVVTVILNGISHTATVTGETWSLALPAGLLPTGELTQAVTVNAVDANGNTETTSGSFAIDTITSVAINTAAIGGNGLVNSSEHAAGTAITGTAQAGASVVVTVGAVSHTVVALAAGTWSAVFAASELTAGIYQASVTAVATDAAANTATATGTFQVDTETMVTVATSTVETDGVVNFVERADGVTLTGTAEAGASVVVTMADVSQTVIASAAGTWSANFAAAGIPSGETLAAVTAVATDAAGNTANAAGTVTIDTFVNMLTITSGAVAGDDIINAAEQGQPITLTDMVEVGSTVLVTLAGVTLSATVAGNGAWKVTYPAGSLPTGEFATQVVVNATDAAGNTASVSEYVTIDTVAGDVTLSPLPIEIDDVVNFVERSDGVLIHGTATPGLTVTVTLGTAVHQVVAADDGTWSSLFLSREIPAGTYMAPITASITDAAGNFKEVADQVRIDTEVVPFTLTTPVEGDDIVSGAEELDGVILSGTVEAGSTVKVTFAGTTRTVVAGADGAWSAFSAANAIANGQYDTTISATATDLAGNTRQLTHDVRIDTIVDPLTLATVEGDDLVSRAEALDGITLTGTVEIGSTVMVTFEGFMRAATVAANGNWSVDFTAAEVPAGEYTANVSIHATDPVGNTRTLADTFSVDTTPPEAPLIESYTRAGAGVRALSTSITDDSIDIHAVAANGSVSDVPFTISTNLAFNETDYSFSAPVPNGSHLVITAADASGNATSTLFVLEETLTNSVNVGNAGLDRFDIDAIDLQFAQDSVLTLTAADLEALCAHSNLLTIHGGLDDTVNILGGSATGATQVIDGRYHDVYSLGTNGGTLIIDEAITVHTCRQDPGQGRTYRPSRQVWRNRQVWQKTSRFRGQEVRQGKTGIATTAALLAMTALGGCLGRGGDDVGRAMTAPDTPLPGPVASLAATSAAVPALDARMKDGTTSPLIEGLLNRVSVLEPGPLAQVADAVMAANTRAVEAELRAAMLRSQAQSLNWLPRLGPGVNLTSLGSIVASLVVDQAIIDHGARRGQRDHAQADVEVAAVRLATDSNARVLSALELYLRAQAAGARAAASMAAEADMERFAWIMRERVAAGVTDRADLQIVTQKQDQMQADLAADREAAAVALAELQAMAVTPLDGVTGLSAIAAPSPTAIALTVMQAEAEGRRAVAAARVARTGYLPGLSAGGNIAPGGGGIGLTVSAPNGIGPGMGAAMQSEDAEAAAVQARLGQEREQAARDVAALQGRLATLGRQQAETRSLADQAAANYTLFAAQQRAGQRSVPETVGVFETRLRAERAAVDVAYEIAVIELRIAARLGALVDGERM